jgi:hypothetical protein
MSGRCAPSTGHARVPGVVRPRPSLISPTGAAQGDHTAPWSAGPAASAGTLINCTPAERARGAATVRAAANASGRKSARNMITRGALTGQLMRVEFMPPVWRSRRTNPITPKRSASLGWSVSYCHCLGWRRCPLPLLLSPRHSYHHRRFRGRHQSILLTLFCAAIAALGAPLGLFALTHLGLAYFLVSQTPWRTPGTPCSSAAS